MDLLKQSEESLAGRIEYLELAPFDALEVEDAQTDRLWLRGGFPSSFLAGSDVASLKWRQDFIRTYLERDIPQFGPRVPAETLRRFWTMPVPILHSESEFRQGDFNSTSAGSVRSSADWVGPLRLFYFSLA